MAHLSKFSRTPARFGNGQYAVSMQGQINWEDLQSSIFSLSHL